MHDTLPLPRPDLDWEENHLNWEKKATRRERKFLVHPRPVLDQTRATGRPAPQPVEPVGPENLSFSIPFFSNTQARSLSELLCQL